MGIPRDVAAVCSFRWAAHIVDRVLDDSRSPQGGPYGARPFASAWNRIQHTEPSSSDHRLLFRISQSVNTVVNLLISCMCTLYFSHWYLCLMGSIFERRLAVNVVQLQTVIWKGRFVQPFEVSLCS